ncbi:hypothetical protein K457DRAFT_160457 [Linnemannia elongata AG-77]|uniref:Secreted protein n=1 Tax=Linnemannia elongata AG-77 TaxID=1314771 RepID=A0A197KFU0_9FUNG|nr:hypothetical protein K457DRAFT_160457 [Linnemannia elongata AG-77]
MLDLCLLFAFAATITNISHSYQTPILVLHTSTSLSYSQLHLPLTVFVFMPFHPSLPSFFPSFLIHPLPHPTLFTDRIAILGLIIES